MREKVKSPQHHKKGGELKYYKMYDKENGAFIQYVRHRGSITTLRNSCYKYIEIKDEKLIAKIKEYKSKAVALKRLEEQSLITDSALEDDMYTSIASSTPPSNTTLPLSSTTHRSQSWRMVFMLWET